MEKKNGCIPWIIILVVLAIIGGFFGADYKNDRKDKKIP